MNTPSNKFYSSIRIGAEENKFAMSSSVFTQPKTIKPPYSWVEHIPFAFFLIHTLKPKLLVELGVHIGNSYNAFCQAVKMLELDTQCYGIDTWQGDEHANFYDESVYNELFAYQQREYPEFSFLLRHSFDEMLESFEDNCIDLLHIDGYHSYEAVKHDFDNWLPKMSEKGVVILHDTAVKERDFGVWKLWEEISIHYPSFNFTHGYGLGVIAVGSKVPQEFLKFLQAANREPFFKELFARLGHYITVLEQNKTLEQLVPSQRLCAQLFIDTGSGFSEEQSIVKTVTVGEQQLEFNLSAYPKIKQLRFDPLNDLTYVEIQQITVRDDNGISHQVLKCQTNACLQHGNHLWFDHGDPNLVLDLLNLPKPQQITVRLKYLTLGNDTYRALWEIQKKVLASRE